MKKNELKDRYTVINDNLLITCFSRLSVKDVPPGRCSPFIRRSMAAEVTSLILCMLQFILATI